MSLHDIDYSYRIVARNIVSPGPAAIKTFLLMLLRQRDLIRLERRKLVALNGLLSQTLRPRHRTTCIIEARYCLSARAYSSLFLSFLAYLYCWRYTRSLWFSSIATNGSRNAEAHLLPGPMAPIRILSLLLLRNYILASKILKKKKERNPNRSF